MPWSISFARAFSSCKECNARITKRKIISHSVIQTHDPWIDKSLPLPLGHQIWYSIDFTCMWAIYSYTMTQGRVFHFCRVRVQYCGHIASVSFCCLIKRYWSNSRMIPMLYNYKTEYTTKHSVACYDVAINSTSKTRLSFNLSIVNKIWWPYGDDSGLGI